jgi:uncharacterized OB-fold protein
MGRNDPWAGDDAAETAGEYFPPSRPWTVEGDSVRLHASRCGHCGNLTFPPRRECAVCGGVEETVLLSGAGTLYSFSEIHVAPKGFATPYMVGYVDLPEGVRLFGQVEGRAAELAVGQKVAVMLGAVRADAAGRPMISYKFKGVP